jgi:DNA-binding HxlR family transcriptional regulator
LLELSAQLMGDRWASLIMRSIFTGIHRFDDIRRDTAIATNILAERLAWLTENGIIRQHQYAAGPERFEYRVTGKGVDYYPALLALMEWGDKYYCSPEGPPVILTHKTCGHALHTTIVCSECRQPLAAPDVTFEVSEGSTTEAVSETV